MNLLHVSTFWKDFRLPPELQCGPELLLVENILGLCSNLLLLRRASLDCIGQEHVPAMMLVHSNTLPNHTAHRPRREHQGYFVPVLALVLLLVV